MLQCANIGKVLVAIALLMSSTNSSTNATPSHLQEVRSAFLGLHKALLDSERVMYEKSYGRIRNSGEFFRLVIGDEWFSWLRPMSQFIALVDETLSAKEPMNQAQAQDLLEAAGRLTLAAEDGTPQEQRFYQAIQRDPDVAIKYAKVMKLLAGNAQQPDET